MRILNHEADAIDCYQDVFLELLEKSDYENINNPGAFLRWLTTRRAIDALRKRQRREARTECNQLGLNTVASAPDEQAEFEELLVILREELATLPPHQAQAFWLVSVEQCSYNEVASQLKLQPSHVGVLVHRARAHVQRRLESLAPHQNT